MFCAQKTGFVSRRQSWSGNWAISEALCAQKEHVRGSYAKLSGSSDPTTEGLPLEMAEQEAIGLLEQLARDFNVRDPRKLFQIARREFPDRRDLTSARAAAALRGDVARQILAPKPRSLGKSAAEGPNDRLQADLVDFSQNTRGRNKYGLVVQDVFTREIATKALPDKRAETAEIIPDLVQEEGNYVVTTDLGNEFQGLEAALPGGAVHRQKDPSDRNATAVVDRAIQTLKKDLAGMVARRGGGWGEHVDEAAEAYNARPHQAVTVAPEDVETMPAASFRAYQDNAAKFQHNKRLTEGRQRRLQEAGAFRAPTNAARSFQPQYGPARDLASFDSMVVRGTDGRNPAQARFARAAGQRRARGPAHPAAGALGGPTAERLQPRPSTSPAHINASRMRSGAAIPVRRQRGSPAGAVVARVEASRPPAGYRLRVV